MALRSRTRSTRLLVVTLVSICLVTITLDYRQGQEGPLAGLGRAALSGIAPLQDAVSGVTRPVGDFVSALADLPSMRAENDRLRERVLELQRDLASVRSDEVRYAEAVGLLELQESLGIDTTGAVVIGTGVDNFDWTITIDKGSNDGIARDMPVVGKAGLVGKVVRVTAGWSQVQLIIDPGLGVGARLVVSREPGILYGRGPADLELQSIERDTPVEVGEAVETSGLGGVFPPGIPIGTVSRIVPDPAALSLVPTVRPAVDFSALEVVGVVLTSQAA